VLICFRIAPARDVSISTTTVLSFNNAVGSCLTRDYNIYRLGRTADRAEGRAQSNWHDKIITKLYKHTLYIRFIYIMYIVYNMYHTHTYIYIYTGVCLDGGASVSDILKFSAINVVDVMKRNRVAGRVQWKLYLFLKSKVSLCVRVSVWLRSMCVCVCVCRAHEGPTVFCVQCVGI